jgi:hypothetical protein
MELVRGPSERARRSLFVHQTGYVSKICEEYAAEAQIAGGAAALRRYKTPLKLRPDAADAAKQRRPGRWADEAPKHVGRLLWAVRGSRPDIANAVLRLGRRVSRGWSVVQDEAMHRLYAYLHGTRNLGIWLVFSPGRLALLGYSDADHANDPENTERSTSAGVLFVRSSGGALMPLEWFSRTQTATARSTAEAEVVSLAELVFSAGLPLQEVLYQITEREIAFHAGTDSQAAEGMVRAGSSRRLAYLRRHQRVSISSLRDVFEQPLNNLFGLRSQEIPADILTKALTDEEHHRGVTSLGMASRADGPPCFAQSAAVLAAPSCPPSR